MGLKICFNDHWTFTELYTEDNAFNQEAFVPVRLPHTCKETPYHYFDESIYQMIMGYRKVFSCDEAWRDQSVYLRFDGVAHTAEIFLNGKHVDTHVGGYTGFVVDISAHLDFEKENVLVVKVNSYESQNTPPFGYVIDYMTYGGIYREVTLEVLPKVHINDMFVWTEGVLDDTKTLKTAITLSESGENLSVSLQLTDLQTLEKRPLGVFPLMEQKTHLAFDLKDVSLWDLATPNLYTLEATLLSQGSGVQKHIERFGFREAVFKVDGFYLNGKKLKIRGLNRHQSYPYVGYAMPKSMQAYDADILKNELKLNAVRTSHYPQSKHFINRCDELGLLVFTEMPGWQHIGDEVWKAHGLNQVKEMILQYRNHPSIIIWGVRINESTDDETFYTQTNKIAKTLDPTRATGGVRYSKKSQLLEDVYTYNDFLHNGFTPGIEAKNKVTSNTSAPYLITEYNGHMFPTKTFDSESHRVEHALRHARVINAIYGDDEVLGGFGWCQFDYNTHKDFGSGDRICYHGVMDMFRNPKLAAAVYASQSDEETVLEVSSNMDVGEYPGSFRGEVYVFTNADQINLYKNDVFIKTYTRSDSPFDKLPSGPILIDDFIGDQLMTLEGYTEGKSNLVKEILIAVSKFGPNALPLHVKLKALKLIVFYKMKSDDIYKLYGKYIGDWGEAVTTYRFDAVKNEKVVKSIEKTPMHQVKLFMRVSHQTLIEDQTYDVASIRVHAVSEKGNLLSFYQEPIQLILEGPLELIGPKIISLKGGMGGTYVKTIGKTGKASLTIGSEAIGFEKIEFEIQ